MKGPKAPFVGLLGGGEGVRSDADLSAILSSILIRIKMALETLSLSGKALTPFDNSLNIEARRAYHGNRCYDSTICFEACCMVPWGLLGREGITRPCSTLSHIF
jgi:hypothetical protein